MQHVLSNHLWREIRSVAAKSKHRQAAIAYVTRDLIGFRRGDVLITDASPTAVSAGETDAKLLSKLERKGVLIHSCPGLHAKVLLLDEVAVIGSGNMSESSQSRLVEAALMSDSQTTVSGIASFIAQLANQSKTLDRSALTQLCRIKVVRRGGRLGNIAKKRAKISPLGDSTWLLGLVEDDFNYSRAQQQLFDEATDKLTHEHETSAKHAYPVWMGRGFFARQCKEGDRLIQIIRTTGKKRPTDVIKPVTVLVKEQNKHSTLFLVANPIGIKPRIRWSDFLKLLKRLGNKRAIGRKSKRLLDPDLADAISRNWHSA